MFLHSGASLHGHEYSNQSPGTVIQTRNSLFRSVFSAPTSPIAKSHASIGATVPFTELLSVQSPSQSQPPSAEPVHAVRRTTPPSTPPPTTVRRRPRPLSEGATYSPSYGPRSPPTPEPSVKVREPEHDYFPGPPRRAATTSWNERAVVGSPDSNAGRAASSVHRTSGRRRPSRKSTAYLLAQPPPKKQRKLHYTRPQLYLQMQQLSSEGRPSPVIDVYPSSAFPKARVAPLLKRYPRISRVKPELGPRDIMLLSYGSDEQGSYPESDSDDKTLKSRDLIAIVSPTRTTEEKTEIILADGIVWAATSRPNGSYDFVSETVKARWVHRTTDDSYTFSILNPNSRKHPIMATLSRTSLGVLDCYTEWEATFILVSASWVALHQGWASVQESPPLKALARRALQLLVKNPFNK
ncbi:hypothetical protein DL766_006628 [Monosporascus sp. MC13-8B]|uniref:Ig-like domain-containing protein n=1 Tax=Monosporascus cannonballus TaxID=155416 RepID=A0ABY0HHL4_9PEZI|nr:hypothetical protein DL762_001845 [Monosporascus cannonballus]RYO98309.1 hypothetical protein DL763_002320 [Monosporascus cannonballus]RYP26718.1 hypothetical protein DL766_006628 [Monosporascus sp. MC13-8B]